MKLDFTDGRLHYDAFQLHPKLYPMLLFFFFFKFGAIALLTFELVNQCESVNLTLSASCTFLMLFIGKHW